MINQARDRAPAEGDTLARDADRADEWTGKDYVCEADPIAAEFPEVRYRQVLGLNAVIIEDRGPIIADQLHLTVGSPGRRRQLDDSFRNQSSEVRSPFLSGL